MKLPAIKIGLVVTALLLLAAGGCDRSSQPNADGTPAPLAEVRLGYFANVTHAQAVLGVSSGEFSSAVAPAKFSTKVFNAGPSLIEALLTGNIDIGYVGPGPAISAHTKSRGEGIRVISGVAANGVLIVARKDSGINSFADLKGKKLATPQQGNTQDISARHYLIKELAQADANNVIAVSNAEQSAMMSHGQIDAAWVPEPWGSRLVAESGAKVIGEEKDLWPEKKFSLTCIVTTPAFLQKHPDVVAKLLGVHRNWTARLASEPAKHEAALDAALEALSGKKLPAGVLKESLSHVTFTNDPLESTFQTMGQWSYDLGFAPQPPDVKGLFALQQVP